jgi:hypothetical protein
MVGAFLLGCTVVCCWAVLYCVLQNVCVCVCVCVYSTVCGWVCARVCVHVLLGRAGALLRCAGMVLLGRVVCCFGVMGCCWAVLVRVGGCVCSVFWMTRIDGYGDFAQHRHGCMCSYGDIVYKWLAHWQYTTAWICFVRKGKTIITFVWASGHRGPTVTMYGKSAIGKVAAQQAVASFLYSSGNSPHAGLAGSVGLGALGGLSDQKSPKAQNSLPLSKHC